MVTKFRLGWCFKLTFGMFVHFSKAYLSTFFLDTTYQTVSSRDFSSMLLIFFHMLAVNSSLSRLLLEYIYYTICYSQAMHSNYTDLLYPCSACPSKFIKTDVISLVTIQLISMEIVNYANTAQNRAFWCGHVPVLFAAAGDVYWEER